MSVPDSDAALQEAFRLVQAGRLEAAEKHCRQIMDAEPDNVNVMGLLGAILLKTGQAADAETWLRRTIEHAPTFAKPHADLGMLYLGGGQAQKAADAFRSAVQLDPGDGSAWYGLATALARLGRAAEAAEAHEKSVQLSPLRRALAEAEKLRAAGQVDRAKDICSDVLNTAPDNIHALHLLAQIAANDGRLIEAEGLLRRIIRIAPDFHLPQSELGQLLFQMNRLPESIEALQEARRLAPDSPDASLFLGDALSVVGRFEEALAAYEDSIHHGAPEAAAMLGRGHVQRALGRTDEAVESYRAAISAQPQSGEAYWNLASVGAAYLSDEHCERMFRSVDAGGLPAESEVNMRFACARVCEHREDYGAAWRQYCIANRKQRQLVKYDPVRTELEHDALIALFDREFAAVSPPTQAPATTPIFVLGMPRSGSTLLEQVLSSHSQVEGLGELPFISVLTKAIGQDAAAGNQYPEALETLDGDALRAFGDRYLQCIGPHRALDSAFITDKTPGNFQHVGFIWQILPQAKIIDARRHPLATCVANFRQLYGKGKNFTYDLQELGEYYLQYARLMEHWNEVRPGQVLTVQYEDVVADLAGQARRILDYCGLPWEDACLDFHESARAVNTASSEQVRRPIYRDALDFWKHYDTELGSLREILAPLL